MPSAFEIEINALLKANASPTAVARDLAHRWQRNLLSHDEALDCAQFLLNAGDLTTLLKTVRQRINGGAFVPWAQLAEALGSAHVKPSTEEVVSLLAAADRDNRGHELVRSRKLDIWSRKISDARNSWQSQRRADLAESLEARLQEIKERLDFAAAQGMIIEEERALAQLEDLFPQRHDVEAAREAFAIKKARKTLQESHSQEDESLMRQWRRREVLPDDQANVRASIIARAKELAAQDPSRAYDLAMMLQFFEFFEAALEILSTIAKSAKVDSLKLELLLSAAQFFTVLDESERIEREYTDDPESVFEAVYARARAYFGIGQIEKAVDIMRTIVRVRPHYKSAQSLLLEWSGGEE